MKKILINSLLLGAIISSNGAFAQTLQITSVPTSAIHPYMPMTVTAGVTKYPVQTETVQSMTFNSLNAPQTINFPPFAAPGVTYKLTSLVFTKPDGDYVDFNVYDLQGSGQVFYRFSGESSGCDLFLNKDGAGNYSASVDCSVGGI